MTLPNTLIINGVRQPRRNGFYSSSVVMGAAMAVTDILIEDPHREWLILQNTSADDEMLVYVSLNEILPAADAAGIILLRHGEIFEGLWPNVVRACGSEGAQLTFVVR